MKDIVTFLSKAFSCLLSQRWPVTVSPIHIGVWTEVKFRNIGYKHMHAVTISEKRDHEYEENQRDVCGKVWREEREERHVIKL